MSAQEIEELINRFYTALSQRDGPGMGACYSDDVTFTDSVFIGLKGDEARAMWRMLMKPGPSTSTFVFSDVKGNADGTGSGKWVATYEFRGNPVVNKISSAFKVKDGKIVEHVDTFDLVVWMRQALGIPGKLFGWFGPFQNFFRGQARGNLNAFIAKEKLKNAGLDFFVDSAGMISYHAGEPPDYRSIEVAKKNGIDISGQVTRMITKNDFETFDLIFAMERSVFDELTALASSEKQKEKVKLFFRFC